MNVGATGLMKDNYQSYLDTIHGKANKYLVQVAAIRVIVSLLKRNLGTSYMLHFNVMGESLPQERGPPSILFVKKII